MNNYAGAVVPVPALAWGAYPRHDPRDIQSGAGKQGNIFFVRNIVKSVLYGKFADAMSVFRLPNAKSPGLWNAAGSYATNPSLLGLVGLGLKLW